MSGPLSRTPCKIGADVRTRAMRKVGQPRLGHWAKSSQRGTISCTRESSTRSDRQAKPTGPVPHLLLQNDGACPGSTDFYMQRGNYTKQRTCMRKPPQASFGYYDPPTLSRQAWASRPVRSPAAGLLAASGPASARRHRAAGHPAPAHRLAPAQAGRIELGRAAASRGRR